MDDYNFFEDLFDMYQSLTPIVQLVWALVPHAFFAGLFAIYLQYRLARENMRQDHARLIASDEVLHSEMTRLSEEYTPKITQWRDVD